VLQYVLSRVTHKNKRKLLRCNKGQIAMTNLEAYDKFMELHQAAKNADDLWWDALVAAYGKDACNARYDLRRNQATPTLKTLYDLKMSTWQEYKRAHDARYNVNA
jgi:hypothetical protein